MRKLILFLLVTKIVLPSAAQNSVTPSGDPIYLETADPKDFKKKKESAPVYRNAQTQKNATKNALQPSDYKHPVPRLDEERRQMIQQQKNPGSFGLPPN